MSREQIEEAIKTVEEMASQVCKYHDLHSNGKSCLTCWRRTENCNKYPILLHLAESNYRKASDIAREIFEEIEAIKCVGLLPSSWVKQFSELKKKYTKSENNNE